MTRHTNKPRILIIQLSMFIGGAERALLGLLDSIDYKSYDVDLLLCSHSGDFLSLINKDVNILPYDKRYDVFQNPIKQLMQRTQFHAALRRVFAKYTDQWLSWRLKKVHSVWHAQQLIHRCLTKILPEVYGEYDLAINFLGVPSILVNHVNARVKATWIHTDYSKIVADRDLDRQMYDNVNYIVNVSDDCKRIFDNIYPEYSGKSIIIENILNTQLVDKLSKDDGEIIPFTDDKINILSIGRFNEVKNFTAIPEICRLMINAGAPPFKWYLIGYGSLEDSISKNITECGVNEYVEILGKRVNPYPYILSCDVYVQPSKFEGKAVTVREAQMLGKPVIVTSYDTAPSQIKNGVDGYILPMGIKDFVYGLVHLLNDRSKLESIANYCKEHTYGNESEVEKVYALIN